MVGDNDVAYEDERRGRRSRTGRAQERPTERRQDEPAPPPKSIDDTVSSGGGGGSSGQQPERASGVAYFLPPVIDRREYGSRGTGRSYSPNNRPY